MAQDRGGSNPKPPEAGAEWRRVVMVVWLSQFFSIMGFSFAMPFAPFYIQELGVTDPVEIKMWVALFASATPLTLAVFSPLWGALADRYGRRVMLLRANFAGAAVLTMMGLVDSPRALIVLRLIQGVLTGTMTAAQVMVSVHAPRDRSGLALGALSAAVFSGSMTGAFLGGVFAETFGFRGAFYASGTLLVLAGLLVLFGTQDDRSQLEDQPAGPADGVAGEGRGMALPILSIIVAIAFVRQFDAAFLPLLVQEIRGSVEGAALWTGFLSAVGSIAGLLAGPMLGRLADRMDPPKVGKMSALGAGLLMAPQAVTRGLPALFAFRFGNVFCAGGLDPVFQVWLSKITPVRRRGFIFGWTATARSAGWVIAPLVSGAVAARYGVRTIFVFGCLLYLCLIPFIGIVARRARGQGGPG